MSGLILPQRGRLSSATPVVATLLDNTFSISNLTTYTFSSRTIGTSTAPHHVIVSINGKASGSAGVPTSVTVGGQSCSIIGWTNGTNGAGTYMLITNSPITLTTGNVVCQMASGHIHLQISLIELSGLTSTTPIDTFTSARTESFSDTLTSTAGGVLVAHFATSLAVSDTSTTWTGFDDSSHLFSNESTSRYILDQAIATTPASSISVSGSNTSPDGNLQSGWVVATFF